MLTYVSGDLFTSPARVLVNTVNTVGVMGKSVALQFKTAFPDMFREYQLLCEKRSLRPGVLWLYKTQHKWILNFPTKEHWRNPSRTEYIDAGLRTLAHAYSRWNLTSIAMPRLGCGNGGLDWESQVRPLVERHLAGLKAMDVFVYSYSQEFTSEHRIPEETRRWLRCARQDLPFGQMWDDLVRLVGFGTEVATPDGRRWTVQVLREPARLTIAASHSSVTIDGEHLFELWQHIRSFGFCLPPTLPPYAEVIGAPLVALLGRLDYMRHVKIEFEGQSWAALQLTPPAAADGERLLVVRGVPTHR